MRLVFFHLVANGTYLNGVAHTFPIKNEVDNGQIFSIFHPSLHKFITHELTYTLVLALLKGMP